MRCRGVDLQGDEVRSHIESGMMVVRLALDWEESVSFVLDDEMTLRKLRFGDTIKDQVDEVDSDDALAKFDAAFSLMSLEINRVFPWLMEALGGEDRSSFVENDTKAA